MRRRLTQLTLHTSIAAARQSKIALGKTDLYNIVLAFLFVFASSLDIRLCLKFMQYIIRHHLSADEPSLKVGMYSTSSLHTMPSHGCSSVHPDSTDIHRRADHHGGGCTANATKHQQDVHATLTIWSNFSKESEGDVCEQKPGKHAQGLRIVQCMSGDIGIITAAP